jgi:nitrite reductase/ring-hydroxylating ferredoxin subunit
MTALRALIDRMGEDRRLEAPAERVADVVRPWFAPRVLKNALSGVWLGHRLHPLLTDAVIGAWASAGMLDAIGGRESQRAVRQLLGAGALAAVPTAAAGLNDYADTAGHARRVALVHALIADVALALQLLSLRARRRGHVGGGRVLSLGALGALGAAGYLGSHLSYVLGVGVDHTAFDEGPQDWEDVAAEDAVTDRPTVVRAGEHEVLLTRVDGRIVALANRCSHAGWPIADGDVADGCITCPHHGSVYRLRDGAVVRGPAASPQLRYEVRARDGRVEVRGPR